MHIPMSAYTALYDSRDAYTQPQLDLTKFIACTISLKNTGTGKNTGEEH